jgi:hypothetical protein
MHSDLQAVLDDFLNTLEEVNILLSSAETCLTDNVKYAAYNKSALLLLSGKFENFIESIAEQYVFIVNQLRLPSNLIPEIMRLHHSLAVISKIDVRNSGKLDEIIRIFSELSPIWATNIEFSDLRIECKFAYGKHGENELKKIFIPLGIEDVFVQVEVFIPDENIIDTVTLKKVDFKGIFNSVMGMRNNILHQNASPNLTHESVREYRIVFESFSQKLAQVLDTNINALNHGIANS